MECPMNFINVHKIRLRYLQSFANNVSHWLNYTFIKNQTVCSVDKLSVKARANIQFYLFLHFCQLWGWILMRLLCHASWWVPQPGLCRPSGPPPLTFPAMSSRNNFIEENPGFPSTTVPMFLVCQCSLWLPKEPSSLYLFLVKSGYKSENMCQNSSRNLELLRRPKRTFFIPVCYYFSMVHAVHPLTSRKM